VLHENPEGRSPPSNGVLYVFYDFDTTQNTKFSDKATLHVPNLVCVQQICSRCENVEDAERNCERCSVRKHSFWDDPVGDMLTYLCRPRPWVRKIVAIAHNAKAFDLHFILNRAVLLKWQPELIMKGIKIMCMKIQHLVFLDSVLFLPFPLLRKLPEAFGLSASKSCYPQYFNTEENLDYVSPNPDVTFYGANEMGESESKEFLTWYQGQKAKVFENRCVLETYYQDDVTVLRQACPVFRREFMKIGNIEVFLEAITIASACNKLLRKRCLKPDTIGLFPKGGYTANVKYSKKALMWLLYREKTDGHKILHGRTRVQAAELPNLIVDGFYPETRTVYEFLGCYFHGHTCQIYCDVTTMVGDTLADRYERTMARIEQIARAGYQVEVQWECEFDEGILIRQPELKAHPPVQHSPLNTRDGLDGGRTEAMRLHHKKREGEETIQYVDVMNLYPYIC